MNLNNNIDSLYNIFIISEDKYLINSLIDAKENNILFTWKNLFEFQEILINVQKKNIDILMIDLDSINFLLLEKIILKMKNTYQLQQLPLIALSSNNDIENRIQILNKGIDDFIEKPIILEEFFARMNSILRRYKKFINEKIIINDDIKINVLHRRVEVRGKQIKISAKEFGILKLFSENCNRIFSRKEILSAVWSDQSDTCVSERTIDVHINRLRVALGLNINGESYIRTVRGEGYSLHIDEYKENRYFSNRRTADSTQIYNDLSRINEKNYFEECGFIN
jgi:DNA-binding response OmpR family regulator